MKYKQRHRDVIELTYTKKLLLNNIFSMQLELYDHLDSLIYSKLYYNVFNIHGSLHI